MCNGCMGDGLLLCVEGSQIIWEGNTHAPSVTYSYPSTVIHLCTILITIQVVVQSNISPQKIYSSKFEQITLFYLKINPGNIHVQSAL